VGKHAVPAGTAGSGTKPWWRQAHRRRQQRQRVSVRRFLAAAYPVLFASIFMDSADVPWYYHPFLVFFGALLPMAVIGWHATTVANFVGERRAQRLLRPRPKATYWLMALGCALVGGGAALLAWAAGANPAGEDWIATGLVWATVISASATLMMAGRALTVGIARRPAWLARRRNAPSANPSVAPATPAIPSDGNGLTAVVILPDLS
jgi:hypothetical protein